MCICSIFLCVTIIVNNLRIIDSKTWSSKSKKDHEIHKETNCIRLPEAENRIELGNFNNCEEAVAFAEKTYPDWIGKINRCNWCCSSCHIKRT